VRLQCSQAYARALEREREEALARQAEREADLREARQGVVAPELERRSLSSLLDFGGVWRGALGQQQGKGG
jgi:hypothetical protein